MDMASHGLCVHPADLGPAVGSAGSIQPRHHQPESATAACSHLRSHRVSYIDQGCNMQLFDFIKTAGRQWMKLAQVSKRRSIRSKWKIDDDDDASFRLVLLIAHLVSPTHK